MKPRRTLQQVIYRHLRKTNKIVIRFVMTISGAFILRYAIFPYLISVKIIPAELLAPHMGPFPGGYIRTLATLICFRLIVAMLAPR